MATRKGVQDLDLEDERDKLRQVVDSNIEKIRRLVDSVQPQTAQINALETELVVRTRAQNEASDFHAGRRGHVCPTLSWSWSSTPSLCGRGGVPEPRVQVARSVTS